MQNHELNKAYLEDNRSVLREQVIHSIAKYYGVSTEEIIEEVTTEGAFPLYDYVGNNLFLQINVYQTFQLLQLEG